MSFSSGIPRKPVPPKCSGCGASRPIAVLRDGCVPDNQGGVSSHEWVCGDCLYRRDHPGAARSVKLPRERFKRLQKETLFDV